MGQGARCQGKTSTRVKNQQGKDAEDGTVDAAAPTASDGRSRANLLKKFFKKSVDKSDPTCYNKIIKREEIFEMTEYELFELEMANRYGTFEDCLAAAGVTIDEFFEDMEREFAESEEDLEDWEEDPEDWDGDSWDLEIGYDPYGGCYSDEY